MFNTGQYGEDGRYRFVDFSDGSSETKKEAPKVEEPTTEKTPEQKLQEAVVNLRSYMNVSKNSPLLKYINSLGGMDFVEEDYKQKVYDAFNEYTAWKNSQGAETTTPEEKKETTTTADTIEYTYKPGDTFGQVVKNLGLESGSGLWGDNGDVAYYTQQLMEQGALNDRGNIPIGTTIRLTRRPVDPALKEYYKKYGYKG